MAERRRTLNKLLISFDGTDKTNLTLNQAERLVSVLNFSNINDLELDANDKIVYNIERRHSVAISKFARTIFDNLDSINDIDELNRLRKSLTKNSANKYYFAVDSVKTKLAAKVQKIQLEQCKKVNRLPESIRWIAEDIAKGKLDVEKARLAIQEEAEKFVAGREKNKFTLNAEQKSRQYIHGIRDSIQKGNMENKIENPIASIEAYAELSDNLREGITAITKNLIARKEYESATSVCEHYPSEEYEACTTQLQREIIRARLGDFILNGIKKGVPEGKEQEFFKTINILIRDGRADLKAVPLGKNRDGSREINLSDIWDDQFNIGR